ncbi:MAG: hypothetical protein ACYC53_08100, partial [Bacillota bacterium]
MSHATIRPMDPEPSAIRARRAWGAVHSAWIGFALWYAFRHGSLHSVGLTGRRFWLGLALAVPVSVLLVLGTLGDPTIKGATLAA